MKESNIQFLCSISVLKSMLKQGIITQREYQKCEVILAKKYHLNKSSLYRDIT